MAAGVMALNKSSPVPLYYQLYDLLKQKIVSGELGEGEKIPSENELSRSLGIGRPTVRQACERLLHDGLLEKRKGSGTYVRASKKAVNIFSMAGTSAAFHEKGIRLEQRLVDKLTVSRTIRDEKNPFSGLRPYFFSRLSCCTGEPILLELIYLDRGLFHGLEAYEIEGQSLARIVTERYFMKPVGGTQSFSVSFLGERYARTMSVDENTPLLLVRRSLHFEHKESAVFSEIFCKTERFEFSQDLKGFEYGQH